MKIEHLQSLNWEGAIRGMRNPLESWDNSDSEVISPFSPKAPFDYMLGPNDLKLAKQLVKAGSSHRKFCRQIIISCDIVAPEKWWAEFDTYEHTVANSTSMMHTFGRQMVSPDYFDEYVHPQIIEYLNGFILDWQRNKTEENWRAMIMNCPMGFLYRRTLTFNYEVFFAMYKNRKNHKLAEWKNFCVWLREELPYMDLFIRELESKQFNLN